MRREPDGRYSVTIPFNEKIDKLESNWDSAVSQLAATLKKFDGNQDMQNLPFGLNSSPFLLCAVIRKQASLKSNEFRKEADSLDSGMYMDDLTSGGDTPEEAMCRSFNMKRILDEAKLPLVKWITSSREVSKNLRKYKLHMREENDENLPEAKILGIHWDPNADIITWAHTLSTKEIDLDVFCDASLKGYGCVIYVCTPKNGRKILIAKSRVAPMGTLTLPKLELTAAFVRQQEKRTTEEEKKIAREATFLIIQNDGFFEMLIARHSDWNKMIRTFSYLRRFYTRFKEEISVREIEITEGFIIRKSQRIKRYDPFLDEQGFLRVGGRLKQSLLSEEEKHPKFLDPLSGVTKLLTMKTHQKLLHGESTEVMFALREKYWILKGRRAIRS
uniref:Reverse transcriptase domain-containing protein n=1 Tax=Strigamia maritima TaxID=126957 RepID=T1IX02_STRMM